MSAITPLATKLLQRRELPVCARLPTFSPNGALWNIRPAAVSLRLDAGELDHLAPLLGLVDNQLAELGRRSRQRRAAEVGEARPHLGVGERRVDLLVELVHDLGWRVSRRTDPIH